MKANKDEVIKGLMLYLIGVFMVATGIGVAMIAIQLGQ